MTKAEFKTLLEKFKTYLENEPEEPLQESTVATYLKTIKTALKRKNPYTVMDDNKLAPHTKLRYLAALRHWARFTEDEKALTILSNHKTFKRLKRHGSKVTRRRRPVSKEQVDMILNVMESWNANNHDPLWAWAVINLAVKIGLRSGVDIAWIQRDAVKDAVKYGDTLTLRTKGGDERTVSAAPIIDELKYLLTLGKWKTLHELISPHAKDPRTACYTAIYRQIKLAAAAAGMDPDDVHPHGFRHRAAAATLERMGDILAVKNLLGHKNIKTTMIYLDIDTARATGEALKKVYDERRRKE